MFGRRKAFPFKKEDLEHPASEGQCLHDLVMNCILREEMNISTPNKTLPPLLDLIDAFKNESTNIFKEMIHDLYYAE